MPITSRNDNRKVIQAIQITNGEIEKVEPIQPVQTNMQQSITHSTYFHDNILMTSQGLKKSSK